MLTALMRYLFIFMIGTLMGWVLEVVYRRYFGLAKKWINPGFLSGPYLPLYGTGITMLYAVSNWEGPFLGKIVLFALMTTGIEYVTGLFFLKKYHTRLWDYTGLKGNIQGIIAPLYTLFWTLLSLVYYYGINPFFTGPITYISLHLEYSFFIGVFYGVFILDAIQSFNIIARLKTIAEHLDEVPQLINYDQLKLDIADRFDELTERVEGIGGRIEKVSGKVTGYRMKLRRPTYLRPFRGDYNLRIHLQAHFDKLREEERLRRIIKRSKE